MLFTTLEFIFVFLPIFLLIYYLCPNKIKNLCIFVFGVVFYAIGVINHPLHLLLFVASIILNFVFGLIIQKNRTRLFLGIGISCNLLVLFVYKYADFLLEVLHPILSKMFGINEPIVLNLTAPIGISFITFQNISYLVYTYRTLKAENSFINYGSYIAMFPQLLSGPLVRFNEIKAQFNNKVSLKNIANGFQIFIFGLGLKVLLANRLGALWKDVNTIGFDSISTPLAWLGIIGFSLQIYFDFWGYSLMAKGLGRMMGYNLPDNFRAPYTALTITDFWRRWHITLGLWFREFVYITLGGNRVNKSRLVFNLFVVWLLTALWHGANWNFILWGLFLFTLIVIEKFLIGKFLNNHKSIAHMYMFFAIIISWLLFAITDISQITQYLQALIGVGGENIFVGDFTKYLKNYGLHIAVGLVMSTNLPYVLNDKLKNKQFISAIILIAVLIFSIYNIKMGQNDPFMYFNF